MKILVTGGAGFIGSNFIHYWLAKNPNDKIINLDALTYAGNLENLKDLEVNDNYKFIRGDIGDYALVNSLLKEVDLVVNFAAESHVDRSIIDSRNFIKTNIVGTYVLLEAAKNCGNVRFHHISTDEVFGDLGRSSQKFNENSCYNPSSPYSASKASADHLVRAFWRTYKLPITISNCSNNYGPYQFPEKIIPLFIINILEGKKVPLYGQGENIRDWIYVDDHNAGLEAIIKRGKIGETYCLGGGSEITNLELAKKILNLLGGDEEMIEYVADRPGHDFRYAIDYGKARKELGWEPVVDLDSGLAKTVEWYKSHKEWWQRIKNKEYFFYYERNYKNR